MSDRGIPQNYRHMHGFGSHTFSSSRERRALLGQVSFQVDAGRRNYTDAEAAQVVAGDRESAQRDLIGHIDNGDFPKWRFCIQVMPEADAATYRYNAFDITKVWPYKDYPLIEVGTIELNRNADNYFSDVEQAAFTPANVVPGIGFSPDRLLQGRLFSYGDAQRYRLGVNHQPDSGERPARAVPTVRSIAMAACVRTAISAAI